MIKENKIETGNVLVKYLVKICVLPILVLITNLPHSVSASEWTSSTNAKFRLVSATKGVGKVGKVLVGLEIKLAPEFQFHGAEPGKFGVPPKFDWSRSSNIENTKIYWPQPEYVVYSTDPLIRTLGYKKNFSANLCDAEKTGGWSKY